MFSLWEDPGFYNYTGIVQINKIVVEPYAGRNIRTFYLINLNDQRLIYLILISTIKELHLFACVYVQCTYKKIPLFVLHFKHLMRLIGSKYSII